MPAFRNSYPGIKEIYSKSHFLVTLKNGQRINGTVESAEAGKKIIINGDDGSKTETTLDEMVYLKGLKSDFWSRVHASIDAGLSFTKANNLKQYNVRSKIGYLADKGQTDIFYDDTRSSQDSVKETKRTEGGIAGKYYLQKDWYLAASLNFLSNTEQALNLRTTGKLGIGKYIVHTNKQYWGLGIGLSFNNESFTNGTADRSRQRNGLCIGVFNWVGIIIEILLHRKRFDEGYVFLVASSYCNSSNFFESKTTFIFAA